MPQLRILIVDDNTDFSETLAMVLTLSGHQCRTANDVASGIKGAAQFQPDIILFDLGMPGNGYTLPAQIRAVCRPVPPLVSVSGYADLLTRCRLAIDGVRLLPKPLDHEELFQLLAEVPSEAQPASLAAAG